MRTERRGPWGIAVGIEYQLAWNRYLQQGVTEHVPQILLKWVI